MSTLWLVGMMGAGKSTVGPLVAESLERDFVDTDQEIERRSGVAVAEWVRDDADGFRVVEAEVIAALAGRPLVVACGGGAILSAGSRRAIRRRGVVVWLNAPLEVLAGRLGTAEGRPLLVGDPVSRLGRLLEERRHLYRRSAHVEVDANGSADVVAERVVTAWNAFR